jgi:hypothetical protein
LDILRLAAEAVPSLGCCRALASYRIVDGQYLRYPQHARPDLDAQIHALDGDGSIEVPDGRWGRVLILSSMPGAVGSLLVTPITIWCTPRADISNAAATTTNPPPPYTSTATLCATASAVSVRSPATTCAMSPPVSTSKPPPARLAIHLHGAPCTHGVGGFVTHAPSACMGSVTAGNSQSRRIGTGLPATLSTSSRLAVSTSITVKETNMTKTSKRSEVQSRVPVATYELYEDAERAVDYLSDQEFPVEHTTIVGVGLRSVENVLGRLDYWRATGYGAATGAWIGLLIGLLLSLFTTNTASWLAIIIWAVVSGAIAGAVFGLVSYAVTGGRRDFISASQIVAEHYELAVSPEHAERARELLQSLPHRPR